MGTSAAAGSLVAVVGIAQAAVAVVAVDTGLDCRAAVAVGRTRRRAASSAADSDRAKRYVRERTPVSGRSRV